MYVHRLTWISDTLAKAIFVIASATVILAPLAASTKDFIGCSPIDVADPTYSKKKIYINTEHMSLKTYLYVKWMFYNYKKIYNSTIRYWKWLYV